ncbi:MAG: peptidoglycan-binding protein [Rhodobacteraceae bacterium]|nr:peptidoglycan-binding protein [Paracoccaceae bacterium]
MHRSILAAILGLTLAAPAQADETIGPQDVLPPETEPACTQLAGFYDCLAGRGLSERGIRFARQLAADPRIGTPGMPVGFIELGAVDLVQVQFPFLANTNDQILLVNGSDGVVHLAATQFDAPADPGTLALLRAYPQAMATSRIDLAAHVAAPGGRQRFVLTDRVMDGCRGCEPVAVALMALEFTAGRQVARDTVGWFPVAFSDPARLATALSRGNPMAVQVALTLHGYQPGPMDGVWGAMTAAALRAFQTDHCLPSTPGLQPEAVALLSRAGPHLAPPPCR